MQSVVTWALSALEPSASCAIRKWTNCTTQMCLVSGCPVQMQCGVNESTSWIVLDCYEIQEILEALWFKQHWDLFFSPLFFAWKLIQASIDQCEIPFALNFSAKSSNLTALSNSRWTVSTWRNSLIIKCATSKTTLTEFSWFNVYPFSFTMRNRHKRQRESKLCSWFTLRDKFPCTSVLNVCNKNFFWRFSYVFVDFVLDANPRNCSVSK